jgi:hypothetical protein
MRRCVGGVLLLTSCGGAMPSIIVRPLEPMSETAGPQSPCEQATWLHTAASEAIIAYDPYGQRGLDDRNTGIALYAGADALPTSVLSKTNPMLRSDPRLATHDHRETAADVLALVSAAALATGATWTTIDLARHDHHVDAAPLITLGVGAAAMVASLLVSPPLAEQRYATFRQRLFQEPQDNLTAVAAAVDQRNAETRSRCANELPLPKQ